MTSSQVVILCIMIGYLVLNVTIGMIMSKRQERASTTVSYTHLLVFSRMEAAYRFFRSIFP